MLGNLFRESGVVKQLADTASNALMYIVVILLGTSVGATTSADAFLNVTTSPLEEVPSYAAMAAEITATSSASPIKSSPAAGTGAAALTGAGATGAGAGAAFSFWPVSHL